MHHIGSRSSLSSLYGSKAEWTVILWIDSISAHFCSLKLSGLASLKLSGHNLFPSFLVNVFFESEVKQHEQSRRRWLSLDLFWSQQKHGVHLVTARPLSASNARWWLRWFWWSMWLLAAWQFSDSIDLSGIIFSNCCSSIRGSVEW